MSDVPPLALFPITTPSLSLLLGRDAYEYLMSSKKINKKSRSPTTGVLSPPCKVPPDHLAKFDSQVLALFLCQLKPEVASWGRGVLRVTERIGRFQCFSGRL